MSGDGRELYPYLEPYDTGYLKVSGLHTIYYEQSGNPDGNPVVYLHGGPGEGCVLPEYRCWFDPSFYRIVLFDQRGAGRSTPPAELEENTTWHLVLDMEKLREHLNIEKWVLFGCSWGTTLALTYALSHTEHVKAMVLQGIFLGTRREIKWFYQDGCKFLWPDLFEEFSEYIPMEERSDLVSAYYKRLVSDDPAVALKAAKQWSKWELSTMRPEVDPNYLKQEENDDFCLKFAKLECHYFINDIFFDSLSYIMDNIHKIQHIPTTIINGRFDVITPMESAWKLHKALPSSKIIIVPLNGHSDKDQGNRTAMLDATDAYKTL